MCACQIDQCPMPKYTATCSTYMIQYQLRTFKRSQCPSVAAMYGKSPPLNQTALVDNKKPMNWKLNWFELKSSYFFQMCQIDLSCLFWHFMTLFIYWSLCYHFVVGHLREMWTEKSRCLIGSIGPQHVRALIHIPITSKTWMSRKHQPSSDTRT